MAELHQHLVLKKEDPNSAMLFQLSCVDYAVHCYSISCKTSPQTYQLSSAHQQDHLVLYLIRYCNI